MKVTLNLDRKYIAYLIISVAVVAGIGYAIAQTPNPGHAWSQIDCSSCVTSGNVNFNYAGSSSKGGAATSALVANSVAWGNVQGRPIGIVYSSCVSISAQIRAICPANYVLVAMDRANCPGTGCTGLCCLMGFSY